MTVRTSREWAQLGRRIRDLRIAAGLSQEDLAEPAYTAAYISHLEHGKRNASQEALTHIARKLGMTYEQLVTGRDPHADLRLEIEIQQAIARIHAGDVKSAERALRAKMKEAQKSGHRRAESRALEGLGQALYRNGDLEGALSAFTRAEGTSRDDPEAKTLPRAGMARCLFQLTRVAEARALLESNRIALESQASPDPSSLVATYAALIPIYFESGLIDKAKEAAREGWRLASEVVDPEQKACLYLNRAQLLLTQDEQREALASLALAEDVFAELGWHSDWIKVGLAKALVLIDEGELDSAEVLLSKAATTGPGISKTDRAQALTQLSLVRRLGGDTEAAVETATRAIEMARGELPVVAAEAEREAGLCELARHDAGTAIHHFREALELFKSARNHEEVAKTARLIGDQLTRMGDSDGASAAYREGLESVKELR